jgi:hypothetical protein
MNIKILLTYVFEFCDEMAKKKTQIIRSPFEFSHEFGRKYRQNREELLT